MSNHYFIGLPQAVLLFLGCALALQAQPKVQDILLTSMCSEDPESQRKWRIRNPNDFDVSYEWDLYGTTHKATAVAPPGDSFFYTKAYDGPNTVVVKWHNGERIKQTVKASSGNQCKANFKLKETTFYEQLPIGSKVSEFTAAGTPFTFTLVEGTGSTHNHLFQIAGKELLTNAPFLYSTSNEFSIRVRRSGPNALEEKVFILNLLNSENAPSDILIAPLNIGEFTAIGNLLSKITVTDADAADSHTLSIEGVGNSPLPITLQSDSLILSEALYFFTNDTLPFRITATDNEGLSFSKTFNLIVIDEPDPPTEIHLSSQSFKEQLPYYTQVATLSATDQLPIDQHRFFLTENPETDNDYFWIDGDKLFTLKSFLYQDDPTLHLQIGAIDLAKDTLLQAVNLYVLDQQNEPTAISLQKDAPIFDSTAIGSFVGNLLAFDPDSLDTHRFELVTETNTTDNTAFRISGDSLFTAVNIEHLNRDSLFIHLAATDPDGLTTTQKIAIEFVQIKDKGNGKVTDLFQLTDTLEEFSYAIYHADFNQDGLSDVLFCNFIGFSKIGINNADGTFSFSNLVASATPNLSAEIADFDQDGDLDIFLAGNSSFNYLWINDGDGNFSQSQSSIRIARETTTNPTSFDVDQDGDTDLILGNQSFFNSVWLNDGAGNFSFLNSFSGRGTVSMHPTDFDQNGVVDLIEVLNNGNIYLWKNDGSGNFLKQTEIATGQLLQSASFDDLNGDGLKDLFMANGQGANFIYLNQGNGVFVDQPLSFGQGTTNFISLGDLDGDNDLDAVFLNKYTAAKIWYNDGNANFTPAPQPLGVFDGRMAVIAPFDPDQDPDIVFAINGGKNLVWWNSNPPSGITLTANSVMENTNNPTFIGKVNTRDADWQDEHQLALISPTNGALFELRGDSLWATSAFDFEEKNSYTVRVRTTDLKGNAYEQEHLIRVVDVNEAPSFNLPDTAFSVEAGSKLEVDLTKIKDGDSGSQQLWFEIISAEKERFEVMAAKYRSPLPRGLLSLVPLATDVGGTVQVKVRLHDSGGQENGGTSTLEKNILINIIASAEAQTSAEETVPATVSSYPNPTNVGTTVILTGFDLPNTTLFLTDFSGNELLRLTPTGEEQYLNLSELLPGMYMVVVSDGEQTQFSKIIKE